MTEFELELQEAVQNNLEREQQLQLIEEEEKKKKALEEQQYIEAVSEGEKQGPTFKATEGEQEAATSDKQKDLYGDYGDSLWEKMLSAQAVAAGGTVRNQKENDGEITTQNMEDYMSGDQAVLSLGLKGTIETLGNALGLVGWLKPVDEALDKAIPPEDDPTEKLVRDIGGLLLPSLASGGLLGAVSGAVQAPARVKVAGEIGGRLGMEALIAYSAGSSSTDENMIQTANELFGLSIPGATTDEDTPAVRRKKHVMDAMGFFAVTELLGLGIKFAVNRIRKIRGTDEVSDAIVKKADDIDPEYPLESAYKIVQDERIKVVDEETIRRLEAGPGNIGPFGEDLVTANRAKAITNLEAPIAEVGNFPKSQDWHDPFIHKHAEPHETYVPNAGANALETKADIAEEVYNPNYPSNGRNVPLATESFERKFMNITEAGDRKDALDELFNTVAPSVEAIQNGQVKYTAQQLNEAVDTMVDRVFDDSLSFDEFQSIVSDMRNNVYQSQKFLTEEDFLVSAKAFKKSFLEMFNPNNKRASALLVKDAAGVATDLGRAIDLLPNKNTANLQAKMFEKLELLASEIRANQYIAGKSLEYKKLVKNGNHEEVAKWMNKLDNEFALGFQSAKAKGLQTVKTYKEIAEKNPEYLKVFAEAVDHTNGRVDTLAKLKAYADKNVRFLKAAFNDDPEAPSWFIKGLSGVRYNSMLSGTSAIKALEGNIFGLAIKPMTATLGAAAQLDGGQFRKALATYTGISENFKRAAKHMAEEWKFATTNPEAAMMKGRADLIQKQLDNFELMEQMAEVWKQEGQMGKVMMWNMSKVLHGFNNSKFARYGLNAMYALDGFTNSMIMSANARAKAYDEVILNRDNYKSMDHLIEAFDKKQKEIYDQFFDADGALRQELPGGVKYQAGELEFNLDDKVSSWISNATDRVPVMKALFAFPRTGINALKYSWTFNPVGGVVAGTTGVGKMGAVFKAKTDEQILDALKMHGINELDKEAFAALKSEYIGRQMVGGTVVTLAALWAIEGNLRGSGPPNARDRKALEAIGWERNTIRNPLTGKWVSYANREPFTSILGTVADIVDMGRRVDQATTEQGFQKAVHAIAVGPTSNTFLSGLRPVVDLMTGDTAEWMRFAANNMAAQVPYSGAVSALNRIITPQLKDVQTDIMDYVKNRYKLLTPHNEHLVDLLDVYTGQPINYTDPINAALNEFVPFFNTNTGEEDFRFKLIESGWKGMPSFQTNKFTKGELHPEERFFINNWVAQNYPLRQRVEELFDPTTDIGQVALKSLEDYRNTRGQDTQKQNPIKDIFMHDRLDAIHREAFNMGFNELRKSYFEVEHVASLKKQAKLAKESGNALKGKELANEAQQIEQQYLTRIRQDFKTNQRQK